MKIPRITDHLHIPYAAAALMLLPFCYTESVAAAAAAPASAAPLLETAGSLQDDGNDVAFWAHPTDPARSLVLASAGTAGLEAFDLQGRAVARETTSEVDFVVVLDGFASGAGQGPLVVGYDRKSRGLLAYRVDPASNAITRASSAAFATAGEVTGLCAYRSPLTGEHYAFASAEGQLEQWKVYLDGADVRGRLVRTIPVGVGAGYCAVDDQGQAVYVSEETVGVWRIAAEPETEAARAPVDLVAPFGGIEEAVKGLAIYRADEQHAYLVAADVKAGRFLVYALPGGERLGGFTIAGTAAIDGVDDPEGIAAMSMSVPGVAEGGLVAVFDEDNAGSAGNVKIVPWSTVATSLKLATARGADPHNPPAPSARTVVANAETPPVDDFGDAADDPAIWVHPTDPTLSLVIGTNKKRGLEVYDLAGRRLQTVADGRMNNVDLRDGVRLGNDTLTLVVATNRTTKSLAFYTIDPSSRRLVPVGGGGIATGLSDPYGVCLYRDPRSGATYVIANDSADGAFRQWLVRGTKARIELKPVRQFGAGSQAEGCVADDETGALYVAEEDVGLWRYSAGPDGGTGRRLVDSTEAPGRLTADAEGVSIYIGPSGRGYLVVSNQGADNYAVYRREGNNEFVGFFDVVADDASGIDGVSETDGLAVSGAPLGPAFPRGLLVVQDGRNITPVERQNFKFVSWARIAEALGLD
jgi:3-phytase